MEAWKAKVVGGYNKQSIASDSCKIGNVPTAHAERAAAARGAGRPPGGHVQAEHASLYLCRRISWAPIDSEASDLYKYNACHQQYCVPPAPLLINVDTPL